MDKFIKRLQTRASRQGLSFNKQQIREVYQSAVKELESPTKEEMDQVIEKLKSFSQQALEESANGQLAVIANTEIEKPETLEITPDSNPDIWETLQPPTEEAEPEKNASATNEEEPNQLEPTEPIALAKADLPTQNNGIIPQSEVKDLVSATFANQPQEFKDQVTEYALEHSFDNVRQVQEFLEQLRGMEFNLLMNTLQDHFNRRGSMLNVLNEVLTGQKQKDEVSRQDFLNSFHNRLANFQQEIEARLTKQGL